MRYVIITILILFKVVARFCHATSILPLVLIMIISFLTLPVILFAQQYHPGDVVTCNLETFDSRGNAMGGAVTAEYGSNPFNILLNPAISRLSSKQQIQVINNYLSNDRSFNGAAYKYTDIKKVIAFSVFLLNKSIDNIIEYDENDKITGITLYDRTTVSILNLSFRLQNELYFGGNIGYVKKDLYGFNGLGIMTDAGFLYLPSENIILGLTLKNPYTRINWQNGHTEKNKLLLKFGVKIMLFDSKLRINIDADKYIKYSFYKARFGLEYNILKYFYLRAGLNWKQITLGFGIKQDIFRIDYSILQDNIDNSLNHYISLVYNID